MGLNSESKDAGKAKYTPIYTLVGNLEFDPAREAISALESLGMESLEQISKAKLDDLNVRMASETAKSLISYVATLNIYPIGSGPQTEGKVFAAPVKPKKVLINDIMIRMTDTNQVVQLEQLVRDRNLRYMHDLLLVQPLSLTPHENYSGLLSSLNDLFHKEYGINWEDYRKVEIEKLEEKKVVNSRTLDALKRMSHAPPRSSFEISPPRIEAKELYARPKRR